MKIALINENSQAAKNEMIYNTLKKVADQHGFEVFNYGMYSVEDEAQLDAFLKLFQELLDDSGE